MNQYDRESLKLLIITFIFVAIWLVIVRNCEPIQLERRHHVQHKSLVFEK